MKRKESLRRWPGGQSSLLSHSGTFSSEPCPHWFCSPPDEVGGWGGVDFVSLDAFKDSIPGLRLTGQQSVTISYTQRCFRDQIICKHYEVAYLLTAGL